MQRSGTRKIDFGWQVVAVAFVVAMYGWGIGFYGLPVFIHTLNQTHGWSMGLLSLAVTGHYLLSSILVVFVADLQQRWGLATTTRLAVLLSGGGVMAWAFADQPWHVFVAAALTAAGWSAMNTVTIAAIVSPWFIRQRPQAITMALNGASAGGILFGPLWVTLIDGFGFPMAGGMVVASMVLIVWPLSRTHLQKQAGVSEGLPVNNAPSMPRRAMLRDIRFLSMCTAFALGLFVQVGTFAHLLTRLSPDMGTHMASYALSLAAISAIVGRFVLAAAVAIMPLRVAAVVNFAVQIVGLILLAFASDPFLLFFACFLFGLAVGNIITLPPLIAQSEFQAVDAGRALALSTGISQGFFAFSPAVFGLAFDYFGTYMPGLVVAAFVQALAAVIIFTGRERASIRQMTPPRCP